MRACSKYVSQNGIYNIENDFTEFLEMSEIGRN